ncbi:chemoreceptor glutamine deamidase CheD [Crenobacter cavernae]|uniref:Probable chemoreceptor glutamine deamidase CheD n=1 Tax=Crenobacter cavernae TaxID=2290923 RepID=A0ABY0FFK0_9NEIS|nr:chemoreceptor glutamine deamidase CheD [Crenobacter cavernae]RXZ45085.1 chemoreceptor glutamine deamidase CheD [Crenobacter cavernae]
MSVLSAGHPYFERHFQHQAVKLLPGEYLATRPGVLLVTVLGSCVAACLRDPVSGVSGMNHFMLPDTSGREGNALTLARFGVHAMALLINDMLKLGAERQRIEAKVFGAGSVLEGMDKLNVGELNARFVCDYLAREQIPVVAEDLLGDSARKVYFFSSNGKVMVKRILPDKLPGVVAEEVRYRRTLGGGDAGGEVELFVV